VRRSIPHNIAVHRRVLAPLAATIASLGATVRATTASPRASVVHLAGGDHGLVADAGCVVSVHDATSLGAGTAGAVRARRHLLASVDRGALLHAPTSSVADGLVSAIGVDPDRIVVIAPGVVPAPRAAAAGRRSVSICAAGRDADDLAEALVRRGSVDVALIGPGTPLGDCMVEPTPSERFPAHLVAALAAGVPVVAARGWTTTAVLQGAARLVEAGSIEEIADAAEDLAINDAARAIAVAAGRARALDYTCDAKAAELRSLYELALRQ
jgi:hypothetical protein